MGYQILFTDLDGTLLDSRSRVTEKNRAAFKRAFEAGKQVVICSGRSWMSLDYFERQLDVIGPNRYGIGFNGGVVYETLGKRFLYEQPMPNALGQALVRALKALGADIILYAGDELLAERETAEINDYVGHTQLKARYVNDFSEVETDIMKLILHGPNQQLQAFAHVIAPQFAGRCNVFFSSEELLEISHPDVDKGRGIAFLAEYLQIPISEVIAMGDQANDIPMLRTAGLGVAVANATPETRAAADVVLPVTNNDDAVAHAIDQWLLA